MRAYYSLLDVFVVARVPSAVCEIVAPLKPLEAMALGVPLVASNVSALREQIEDGVTGLLFDANRPESLAAVCTQIASDSGLRDRLRKSARDWVQHDGIGG